MLGFVSRFVGEDGNSPDGTDVEQERNERVPTRLYECPECEAVYLSADLAVCPSCETEVEPVPSEHDLGFGTGEVDD